MAFRQTLCLALAASLVGARDPLASAPGSDLQLMQARPPRPPGKQRVREVFTHAGVPLYRFRDPSQSSARDKDGLAKYIFMLATGAKDVDCHTLAADLGSGAHAIEGDPDHGGLPFVAAYSTIHDLLPIMQKHKDVLEFVEEDRYERMVPEDPEESLAPEVGTQSSQNFWGIDALNASNVRRGYGSGVSVYVLDTGVRTTHQEFGGRAIPTLDSTRDPVQVCSPTDASCAADDDGHGTHTAGTVAGQLAGVADGATIRAVKVLRNGNGMISWVVAALSWIKANRQNPAVVSMSLGGAGKSDAETNAVNQLTASGVPVVVAAGNDASDACGHSPAGIPSAITVGAFQPDWKYAYYSNYGSCVDVFAPGTMVKSAGHSSDIGYAMMSGTSMACPHVAGLLARLLQAFPSAASLGEKFKVELLTKYSLTGKLAGLPANSVNLVPLAIGPKAGPEGYVAVSPGCVFGSNMADHGIKTASECAALCSSTKGCLAFEYGFDHGGSGPDAYAPGACVLQSGAYYAGCNGVLLGVDLYLKIGDGAALVSPNSSSTPSVEDGAAPISPSVSYSTPSVTATDDPHLTNLAGEHFQVNVPGEHLLLRVPRDVGKPALLQLNASMTQPDAAVCGLYITSVTLTGEWFGEDIVRVRSHTRNVAGSNTAGNQTLWEFSTQVSRSGGLGEWVPFVDVEPGGTNKTFYDSKGKHDSGLSVVRAYAARKEQLGHRPESQEFKFELGLGTDPTAVTIAQASHQALNIAVARLDRLGYSQLGGLLGTEPHDRAVETLPDVCLVAKAKAKAANVQQSSILVNAAPQIIASAASASW